MADARPAGPRHKPGGQFKQASLGSRRRRSGRPCLGTRSHRRPVRGRGRCNRGRSHHRHVGRIDGSRPDHQRDTAGRTVCRDPRRGASATRWRRWIGQGTRSALSRGRTTWSGRTESSVLLRMRPTCAAGWAPRRSKWMLPDGSSQTRWRDIVAARLPSRHWPQQPVLITAVDARTGEPVVFDRDSGIDLVDAVAASTSAMTPYCIGEDRYINGGYRRSENADLAAGCGRVLVLSPFGGRSRMPLEWGMDLATQVDELRAGGSRVETVFPDGGAGDVFDANALDPSTASAGRARGLRPRPRPRGATRRNLALTPATPRVSET